MSYYTFSNRFVAGTRAKAAAVDAQFDAIETGFASAQTDITAAATNASSALTAANAAAASAASALASSGVTAFNARTGSITLLAGDVNTALGYTAANVAAFAGYAALTGAVFSAGGSALQVGMRLTSAPTDTRLWDWIIDTDGTLQLRAVNDTQNAATSPIKIYRTGTALTAMYLSAATSTFYGHLQVSGGQFSVSNDIGGGYGGQMGLRNLNTGGEAVARINSSNDLEWLNAAYTVNAVLANSTGNWSTRGVLFPRMTMGGTGLVGIGRRFVLPTGSALPGDLAIGDTVLFYTP